MDIKIIDLTKKIDENIILDQISLNINKGNTELIVGRNGAGKTTLIRIILNLYNATSGKITVDNVDVKTKEYNKIKEKIGFLNDNIGLFKDLTAWDNIEFFHRIYFPNAKSIERKNDIERVLKIVDLYNKKDSKITFFSRGMKQRLAIARAIVNNPKLLILDEPSRGLDIEGKEMLMDIIKQFQKDNCTILINSHDLDDFQHIATNMAFLKEGKIICEGSYKDLQTKFGSNSYSLKVENGLAIKIKLGNESFISSIDLIQDELIINLNGDLSELSSWLYNNNIKVDGLKKINDNLSHLYKTLIG